MNLGRQSQSPLSNSTLIELRGQSYCIQSCTDGVECQFSRRCIDESPRKSPAKAAEHVLAARSECFINIRSLLRRRNANKDMVSPWCLHKGQIPAMCPCTASHASAQCHKKGTIPPFARMWPVQGKVASSFADIASS